MTEYTGLEHVSNKDLIRSMRKIKVTMDTICALPRKQRHEARGKGAVSPAVAFQLARILLNTHEREMVKRGLDPSDPKFGFDWNGLIRECEDA